MWWSLMAEKPTLIPYEQESGPTYPGVKVLTLWPQSQGCFRPCLPLSPPPSCLSRSSSSLCPPSLWPPPPPSHTHTLSSLTETFWIAPLLFAFSELGKHFLTSYPFPYLCLLIHPSQSQLKCILCMMVPPRCSTYNDYYKNWPRGWKRTWEILFSVQWFLNFPVM